MSIFKRFSSKKSGEKASELDQPALNEDEDLTIDSSEPILPASVDDAIPSLKGFSPDEKDVIRSILADEPTRKSNFNKTNRKKGAKAATTEEEHPVLDDYLSDEAFRNTLNILKGDLDIETELDTSAAEITPDSLEETEIEAEAAIDALLPESPSAESDTETETGTETEDIPATADIETAEENMAEEPEITTTINYPERLTATATFHPAEEKVESAQIIEPEVEQEAESASYEPPISGEEDMTSREDNPSKRSETYDLRRQADVRHDDITNTQRRINLGEMRMDVANIMSDIENGETMYRRAQQRVENLTGFIERAEVDFSLLDRLEPENRFLKSENLTLQTELDKRKTKIAQMTSGLEDLQRRYGDAQSELDATQGRLSQTIKTHERAERDIAELNAQIQEFRLKSDRMRNDLEVESRENGNLRGRIAEITTQLDKVTAEKLQLAKQIESLKIDLADQSENRHQLRDEVNDLRHNLEDAQRQNTQMRGEITGVHEDIRGFKTQYEFNILKRDERITDLEGQIAELTDRLRVKEDQMQTASRELSNLRKERTTQDLERERLEKSVEQVNSQLYRTEEELLRSRKTADELDTKYRDISATLARTEQRRQSSEPAAAPDIAPPPFHQAESRTETAIEETAIETDDIKIEARAPGIGAPRPDLTRTEAPHAEAPAAPVQPSNAAPSAERIAPTRQITDDIEDMLTDYKLGLRNIG